MPGKRPPTSGYARIAQAEEEEEDQTYPDDDLDPFTDQNNVLSSPVTEYSPIQPRRRDSMRLPHDRRHRRKRTNSGVDIKAINARLERWADEIKDRFTRRRVKGKSSEEEHLEIHHSVFTPPDWIRPATKETLAAGYGDGGPERMSKLEFDDVIESVRTAIELGTQPKLIAQGSSGSYFARNSGAKVVGVFKPKDEEPYANKNPKWTKWLHRNLLPFAFGRAMLIPNLSYVSEAAAYVLDCQLRTNIVPYTAVVSFSSPSFHYDWIDWRAHRRKRKPLPEKPGSFQVFLKGYRGATEFFREHPWPDSSAATFRDAPSAKRRRKRWDETCRPGSTLAVEDVSDAEEQASNDEEERRQRGTFWTDELQLSFRGELEKLVVLDYIMRNTDRGTDNWMIRIDRETQRAAVGKEVLPDKYHSSSSDEGYSRRAENMTAEPARDRTGEVAVPHIGAIDNSLSWPWKHPDAWRSYPFGWLFLPVNLIGRPFSEQTRRHFLPLLTSKDWWSETQVRLRRCFELDADFQEKMFARQMAVMKGQAWNVVETLKTPDHGPLELTRRSRVLVWDDLVDIPVAVPLPRASAEMRKRAAELTAAAAAAAAAAKKTTPTMKEGMEEVEEEMDISAARHDTAAPSAASPPIGDLLSFSGPDPNPFNHSRHNSSQDVRRAPEASSDRHEPPPHPHDQHQQQQQPQPQILLSPTSLRAAAAGVRPGAYRSRTGGHYQGGIGGGGQTAPQRKSYDVSRSGVASLWGPPPSSSSSPAEQQRRAAGGRRRFSFTVRRNHTFGLGYGGGGDDEDDDDDDGDLGYAAAATQESSMRRVIVERLEMVKAKTPFFSWC